MQGASRSRPAFDGCGERVGERVDATIAFARDVPTSGQANDRPICWQHKMHNPERARE
jgi:hypothetical protein